jgi:hypothetical protein
MLSPRIGQMAVALSWPFEPGVVGGESLIFRLIIINPLRAWLGGA